MITSVRELSGERLLVSDRGESRLYLVDLGSREVETLGGIGDGPGEYRTPGFVYPLGADTTLFTDFHTRRWHVVHGADIVETISADQPLSHVFGPALSGTGSAGRLLGVVPFLHSGPVATRVFADSLFLLLTDLEGQAVDTVARVGGRGRMGGPTVVEGGDGWRGAVTPDRRGTEEPALLFDDGWIAIARTDPYRIEWRSPNGTWISGPSLPYAPIGDDFPPFRYQWDPQPTLLPLPDGRLLVHLTQTDASTSTDYDLIDRRGERVGTVTLPPNERFIGTGDGSIYVVSTDEWGLQQLRRHPWRSD